MGEHRTINVLWAQSSQLSVVTAPRLLRAGLLGGTREPASWLMIPIHAQKIDNDMALN